MERTPSRRSPACASTSPSLGTNGITVAHGLSTPTTDGAAAGRAMVAAGRLVVCLTDSSKVGTEAALQFATLDEIDVLVTDSGATSTTGRPSGRRARGRGRVILTLTASRATTARSCSAARYSSAARSSRPTR